jgi:hypothetical protein
LKGAFVCAYVGERVSEEDLQIQEENKLAALQFSSAASSSASSVPTSPTNQTPSPSSSSSADSTTSSSVDVMTGYVTYAFQIHDGTDVVNIDSEYDPSFLSCDPPPPPLSGISGMWPDSLITVAIQIFAL